MGLGAMPGMTLAMAREKALECTRLRRQGIDPMDHREAQEAALRAAAASRRTLQECVDEFIAAGMVGCTNVKAAGQWPSSITDYCSDLLPMSVEEIETRHILSVLEPIWRTKNPTATRLRGRLEAILEWAAGKGYRPKGNNPAQWKGNLKPLLIAPSKIATQEHHRALPFAEMGKFMSALREQEGVAARALELIILTATRTSEVLNSTWDEFDLSNRVWTIPAARMKARQVHRVPLSEPAVKVLEAMLKRRESQYVFPGVRINRPLSNMACLKLLDRMKMRDRVVVHGFRSTFRDWAADATLHAREVVELALAHSKRDETEAAYWRSDLLERRRLLMEDWALFCGDDRSSNSNVVPLRKAA